MANNKDALYELALEQTLADAAKTPRFITNPSANNSLRKVGGNTGGVGNGEGNEMEQGYLLGLEDFLGEGEEENNKKKRKRREVRFEVEKMVLRPRKSKKEVMVCEDKMYIPQGSFIGATFDARTVKQTLKDRLTCRSDRKRAKPYARPAKGDDDDEDYEESKANGLDAEGKKKRRMEKNRKSAQLSRLRKKAYLESLQWRVELLKKENTQLQNQLASVISQNDSLRSEVVELRDYNGLSRIPSPSASWESASPLSSMGQECDPNLTAEDQARMSDILECMPSNVSLPSPSATTMVF